MRSRPHRLETLTWSDAAAETIPTPGGPLKLSLSVGSGLAFDGARLWGLGDRGPNLKIDLAVGRYRLDHLAPLADRPGVKIMPSAALGPEITQLVISGDGVQSGLRLRLTTPTGRPVPGLPLPGGDAAAMEPVFGLDGTPLAPDPDGMDTEGLAIAPDGGFWVAEEYGPSLVRVDPGGVCRARYGPASLSLMGAEIPFHATLPAIAARRRLNRGFEAVAVSPDGSALYTAFQSALDRGGHTQRHTRLWVLDPDTGRVAAEHLYPFDRPEDFVRDGEDEPSNRALKIGDMVAVGPGRLLVLERISRSSKLYLVKLGEPLPARSLDEATRPRLEDMGLQDVAVAGLPVLAKTLVLDTDEIPQIAPDLEGLALIDARTVILATDNDYGIEGVQTRLYRVTFSAPLV